MRLKADRTKFILLLKYKTASSRFYVLEFLPVVIMKNKTFMNKVNK